MNERYIFFVMFCMWGEAGMIDVTKINGKSIVINADIIQAVEETPDTVITLTTGTKYIVKESSQEIKDKVISYKRSIFAGLM